MKVQYYPRFERLPPSLLLHFARLLRRRCSLSPGSSGARIFGVLPAAVRSSLAGRPPFPAVVSSSLIGRPSAPRSAAPSPAAPPAGCLLRHNFGSFAAGHGSFVGRLPPLQSRAQGQPLRCPLLLILSSLLLSTPIKRICPSLSTPL